MQLRAYCPNIYTVKQVQVPECEIVTITKYIPVPDRECTVIQQNQCKTITETTVEEDCQNEKKEECTTRLDTKFETHYEEKCQEVKGGVISDGLFNLVLSFQKEWYANFKHSNFFGDGDQFENTF